MRCRRRGNSCRWRSDCYRRSCGCRCRAGRRDSRVDGRTCRRRRRRDGNLNARSAPRIAMYRVRDATRNGGRDGDHKQSETQLTQRGPLAGTSPETRYRASHSSGLRRAGKRFTGDSVMVGVEVRYIAVPRVIGIEPRLRLGVSTEVRAVLRVTWIGRPATGRGWHRVGRRCRGRRCDGWRGRSRQCRRRQRCRRSSCRCLHRC